MTMSPSKTAAGPRRPRTSGHARSRSRAPLTVTAVLAAVLVPLLASCGQQGPLRHPWESSAEARENAQSRRLPTTTRDNLPSPADGAASSGARP